MEMCVQSIAPITPGKPALLSKPAFVSLSSVQNVFPDPSILQLPSTLKRWHSKVPLTLTLNSWSNLPMQVFDRLGGGWGGDLGEERRRRDNISTLAWERLGIPPVRAGRCGPGKGSLLELLPSRPDPR